ncbi:MAG: [protein-PII] uridylyltransferase [Paracoccaceae bacterium]|nr:[protein-PII] uridylyltransferase [Paracoccaceae bacterium]
MTPPQEVSAAPEASREERPASARAQVPPSAPPSALFDKEAVGRAIDARVHPGQSAADIRAATVACLKAALADGRATIGAELAADPWQARGAAKSQAVLIDNIVRTVFEVATGRLHPLPTPTDGERLAVIAVGGYGRGELAPQSDVDLLFVTPYKLTPWAESVIEQMLYMLWDLHLKVGHASRTIRECIRLGRDDYTIRTALLENRFLAGDVQLAEKLDARLWSDLFEDTASDFIEAKLKERAQRHIRQGGQRYMVEPNVKEGKGGLRDLQTLFWIAKYVSHVDTLEELEATGMFRDSELRSFLAAEDFLLAVRTQLHLLAGRPMDQLTFDMQVEVADRLGYRDGGGRRAVEHFMQDYFLHATKVGDLTRILLTGLEARHVKAAPDMLSLFRRRRKVPEGYEIVHNRINVANPFAFLEDKLNMLRIFEVALRQGVLLHPDAMRLLSDNLHLIDAEMRASAEANRIFLDLLLKHGNPERALRRMNESGVLSTFLPEFAPVVAMMQFNMYHSYTVDEHTIQCISHLARIEKGELVEELPIASRILKAGLNRRVLYVALLLHDIGKGRPEDHSVLGAQIARRVAPRLGLRKSEAETVEWLVRHHLLMSDMAQKRDVSDPRTVRDFAKAVQTTERLDLLTVLTVCDIRGVGPQTWNNWKAQLLRALYRETWNALEGDTGGANRKTLESEAKRALRTALKGWAKGDVRTEVARHYSPYWQGVPAEAHIVFANLLKDLAHDEVRIDVKLDADRDATRVCFALHDHPGIFARLAGALALVGANVVDARSFTTKDGFATAVFWIQDAEDGPYEADRLPRLRATIDKTLKGEIKTTEAFERRDKLKKRERAFEVPTSISFDNEGSDIYTIIEVDTRDRPGLLFDLARTLTEANVNIASAVVATYGEQVVDSFYVKDSFGLKLHSDTRRQSLEKRLREAIIAGAERARRS